ncbi:CLUMA_CG000777, isoform A [Clunio marinus]|uniref:CLUMA_CG000777, isoform A n=1 Tax=Clunio marinus TaxID=568069 RepID=A0A1J1HL47_9DIPT|nr:CLUMA_CG000777, isoform A [Clunio marinus]
MTDYRKWCRICGALESLAERTIEAAHLSSQIFDIPVEDVTMCFDCSYQIETICEMKITANKLSRLFFGLKEESDVDLTIPRLNAYRAHFNLRTMIQDDEDLVIVKVEQSKTQAMTECEYKEMEDEESEIFKKMETVKETTITEIDSNMIYDDDDDETEYVTIKDEMIVEEDESKIFVTYQENIEECIEESCVDDHYYIEYTKETPMTPEEHENHQSLRNERSSISEKNEDEKLFNFHCHVCDHPEFMKMKSLESHCKTVHNCLPQVKCCSDDCDSVLSTWRRLMIHKSKHFPNEDDFRCNDCNRAFATIGGLEKHLLTHNTKFICTHCGKSFKETKTLKCHERTHVVSIEDRRNHECPFVGCDLKFITKQACQNHYEMKHNRIVNFYCQESDCGKGFYTRKHFYEHQRVHSDRKFHCNQCEFKTKTKSALNVHKEVHTVDDAYSCDLCNATFSAFRRLKSHMIVHSDHTPHQCEYCDSAFKRRKDLKSHLTVHTKERPYCCQFCSRSFANAANCRKHKLKDHNDDLKRWESVNGVGGRKNLQCYQ